MSVYYVPAARSAWGLSFHLLGSGDSSVHVQGGLSSFAAGAALRGGQGSFLCL